MISVLVLSKSDQLRSAFNSFTAEKISHHFVYPEDSQTMNFKDYNFILLDKQSLGTPITDSMILESKRTAPTSKIVLLTSVDTLSERYKYLTRGVHLFLSGKFPPERIYSVLSKFIEPRILPV